MGIDIGFVGDDLARCPQARCAGKRNTIVGFVDQIQGRMREIYRLDTRTIQGQAPDHYRPTEELNEGRFALVCARREEVVHPASEPTGDLPTEAGDVLRRLCPGGRCLRSLLAPQRLMGEREFQERLTALREREEGEVCLFTAWGELLGPQERLGVCSGCPLRPPDQDSCYARFSNYPGMASLKLGLAAAIEALACIDRGMQEDGSKEDPFAWWSFQSLLERTGNETLLDLHQGLLAYFGEESPDPMRQAEGFFRQVTRLVGDAFPQAGEVEMGSPGDEQPTPHRREVETLLAGLIYRSEPYDVQEMGFLLPRLHAYTAAAEWALWGTRGRGDLHRLLLSTLDRWRTLVGMLRTGWLLGLRVYVSY